MSFSRRLVSDHCSTASGSARVPGFGIRVHATGRKIYVAQARTPGGLPKRAPIGRYVEMSTEDARRKAAEFIDRIRRGEEPVPPPPLAEPTVADLAERYMTAHVKVNCRPGTVETFGRLVDLYILPELGDLKLSEVDRSHVSTLHHKYRGKPTQANQAVGVFSKMFKLAVPWGMTPARPNPCRSVRRYKERGRERFLTSEEYARLGRVLFEAEAEGPLVASGVTASQPSSSPRSARRCRSISASTSTAVSMRSSLASTASGATPGGGRRSGPAARWQMKREMGMPAASARSRMRRHSVSVAITVRGRRLGSGASCIVCPAAMWILRDRHNIARKPARNTHELSILTSP